MVDTNEIPVENGSSKIQIVNDRKMYNGKFYVLDSDNDSEDELYSNSKKGDQPKKRQYKRLKKHYNDKSDGDQSDDDEQLEQKDNETL